MAKNQIESGRTTRMLADYNTTQKKQTNTNKRIDDIENSTFVLFDDNRTQKLGEDAPGNTSS